MLGEFNMQKIRKAVIPAAGYGTRFLPATKATPKEMLPIVDKPTIQYIVEEALASGIEEILIVSGHGKRAIEDHFDSAPTLEAELKKKGKLDLLKMVQDTANIRIHYIRQRYMRGLGDAILCAKAFMGDEPFAVLLGDDVVYNPEKPALRQLIDVYDRTGGSVLGCQMVPDEKVSSYGIVAGDKTDDPRLMRVRDMIEKPSLEEAPSRMAVLGRYIIRPESLASWSTQSPARAARSSSRMRSRNWRASRPSTLTTSKASATTSATSSASSRRRWSSLCAVRTSARRSRSISRISSRESEV